MPHCATVSLLLVLISCTTAASAQQAVEIPVPADQAYVHTPTGLIFPASLGSFLRVGVHRYGPDESNISAGYNDNAAKIAVTAYAYPPDAGVTLTAEFEQVKIGITTVHPDAKLVSEGRWTLRQNGHDFVGLRARYAFSGDWAGRHQDLLSDAYLLPLGTGDTAYLVKFRITYPAARETLANQRVDDLLARLPFPFPAPPSTQPTTRPH